MAYTQWIRVTCECGFHTETVEVGRVGFYQNGEHDSWQVARFDHNRLALITDVYEIPLDYLLNERTVEWLCREVLSKYQETYGHCFVFTTRTPFLLEMPCPICERATLMLERVA